MYFMDSWEHLEHFRKVIQAHAQAGIKIKLKKTKIFQSEVEYLGRKVSQDKGRCPLSKDLQDITVVLFPGTQL